MVMPSLIDINRAAVAGPGLHAILIGVSEYGHLPPHDQPAEPQTFEMKKLRSPALSAYRLHEWLLQADAAGRLAKPLKTLRLLTAASAVELATEPQLARKGETAATRQAIRDALWEWRHDAGGDQAEMTLFYFAGHGIRRSLEESILLAADFCDPADVKLARAFHLANVRNGMAPSATFPDIARTQFYFVDACRNKPELIDKLDDTAVPKIFDVDLNSLDNRQAPILFATVPGDFANARAGRETAFCEALRHGLEHGSEQPERLPGSGSRVWPVKAQSLKDAIDRFRLRHRYPKDVELTGLVGDPTLCHRPDPPSVDIDIELLPGTFLMAAMAQLEDFNNGGRVATALDNERGLLVATVPAGLYLVDVQPTTGGGFVPRRTTIERVTQRLSMPWQVELEGNAA
jgi:hypothetical protein